MTSKMQPGSRDHFVTRQDVRNIQKSCIDLSMFGHSNDTESVCSIVQQLQQESHNPVLLYKKFGQKCESVPDLPADSFLLAIQTRHQQLFQAFASKVVCMDSTHGTNHYDFKLITVMVADQFGQGLYCTTLALISEPTYSCIHRQNSWMVHL